MIPGSSGGSSAKSSSMGGLRPSWHSLGLIVFTRLLPFPEGLFHRFHQQKNGETPGSNQGSRRHSGRQRGAVVRDDVSPGAIVVAPKPRVVLKPKLAEELPPTELPFSGLGI